MSTTATQNFILYSLGTWFEQANKKIKNKHLQVSISKTLFIELVHSANLAQKQKRALYKNLETLEKKKLLAYQNKELTLTAKGEQLYKRLHQSIEPYLLVHKQLQEKTISSYTKKVQTVFR